MSSPKRRSHPYSEFEDTAVWTAVDKAINDLVKNGDLVEETKREYIVGYICKALVRQKCIR